jgi:hypothetical protein
MGRTLERIASSMGVCEAAVVESELTLSGVCEAIAYILGVGRLAKASTDLRSI